MLSRCWAGAGPGRSRDAAASGESVPRLSLLPTTGYAPAADVMRERSTKDSSFPHWVALGSLVFVLAMFFSNTVPALRERESLQDLQVRLAGLRDQFEDAIEQTRKQAQLGQKPDASFDLQSLLVAIDQQNATPLELWQRYQGQAVSNSAASNSAASNSAASNSAVPNPARDGGR